jgi:hypothetical protein
MSSYTAPSGHEPPNLERSVEDLLGRARPLPPRDELIIDDIDEDEGRAFLAAIAE